VHPELWDKWEAIFIGNDTHQGEYGPNAARNFYESHQQPMLEGTKVLWPQLEDYYQLMVMRVSEGRISFQSEKQNEPIDPKTCIFREEMLRYWDKDEAKDVQELIQKIGPSARFYGACDPSLGRKGPEGDYTAIVVLMKDKVTKVAYVIVADIARRSPDQTLDQIVTYARIYGIKTFAVESNQFQELLAEQLSRKARAQGLSLHVEKVNHSSEKQSRIQSLEPYVAQGLIRFSWRQQMLIEQLRQFPHDTYDDGPDALEMAAGMAFGPQYTLVRSSC